MGFAANGAAPIENAMWMRGATLFELLSKAFGYADLERVAQTLVDGSFAATLAEAAATLQKSAREAPTGIADNDVTAVMGAGVSASADRLSCYVGQDAEGLFHRLRAEHTRLFVGAPHAIVSPYAGVWYAQKVGVDPVLYVNKESMAVERTVLACGLARPAGTNEPLDHIATECEFASYLCLCAAGAVENERIEDPVQTFGRFAADHMLPWIPAFAQALCAATDEPLFLVAADVAQALVEMGPTDMINATEAAAPKNINEEK